MKLSLFYPVYSYWVNRAFGFKDPLYTSMGLLGHDGIDLQSGERICSASQTGVVSEVSLDYNRGLGVYVTTGESYDVGLDKPYRIAIAYWHFKQVDVAIGDRIAVGDRLGITDNTGQSSGNHLHFAVQPRKTGDHGGLDIAFPNNGYRGFIDPSPFWNKQYAFQFNNDLYLGQTSEEIKVLQAVLGGLPTTGFFGSQTFSAVRAFQKANGIISTGYVGSKTRAKLNNNLRT